MKQNSLNAAVDQKFISSIQDHASFQQQSVLLQAPMNTSQTINIGTLPSPSSAMSNPSVLYDQRSYTMNPYNRYNDPNTNGPYFGVQNIYTNTNQNNGIGRESTANDTMNRIMNIAEYKPY
ncbi:hypothetical protein BKA69DRAFT_1072955 [Paraphysoderma sedebokerense]|nr:hypothetical protein BKA69DRAFT_1072955 [Paraphysoderma sedebokerense]